MPGYGSGGGASSKGGAGGKGSSNTLNMSEKTFNKLVESAFSKGGNAYSKSHPTASTAALERAGVKAVKDRFDGDYRGASLSNLKKEAVKYARTLTFED